MKISKTSILIIIIFSLFLVAVWQFFYNKNTNLTSQEKQEMIISNNPTFNQVLESKENEYKNIQIIWNAKISKYYSQITGIKFCVLDSDHKEIDTNKQCDWFWASSKETENADAYSMNPNWNGNWVNYILNNYQALPSNKSDIYNQIYQITGRVNGIDCGVDEKCHPDIEIINIKNL